MALGEMALSQWARSIDPLHLVYGNGGCNQ